jgi:hypothetical protein
MHVHPLGRRVPRVIPVVWLAVLLAIICTGSAIAAVRTSKPPAKNHPKPTSLAGTWKGQYSGAFSGTFTLHWTEKKSLLTGSITLSSPSGKYGISGSVHGSAIKFGAVGVGATYTGKVSGKSMKGTYNSPKGGGTWSANKTA